MVLEGRVSNWSCGLAAKPKLRSRRPARLSSSGRAFGISRVETFPNFSASSTTTATTRRRQQLVDMMTAPFLLYVHVPYVSQSGLGLVLPINRSSGVCAHYHQLSTSAQDATLLQGGNLMGSFVKYGPVVLLGGFTLNRRLLDLKLDLEGLLSGLASLA